MKGVAIQNKEVQSQIKNIFVVVNKGVPRAFCRDFTVKGGGVGCGFGGGRDEGRTKGKQVRMNGGHLFETAGGGRGFPSPRRLRSQCFIEFRVSKLVSSAILVSDEDKGALARMVMERRGRRTLSTLSWEVVSKTGLFDSTTWGLKITKQGLGLCSMRNIGSW
ncbi:S ribonuclease [Pyrus ussuriensis x Pyrus communis]|uniref:S ribonuclease n=1 Tax=Pyrus ussuriensis x Pyrus communis TaxID=2448454 RepID=A0A5N5HFL6_9ROSA|nr:S ribonuclease [Pyrus ussuriensis x Pyrus communis]